jgi:hypothetical protein
VCRGALSKYRNVKVRLDGYVFDSKKEADRYLQLLMREKVGEVSGLTVHPRFDLEVNEQRACRYVADFSYYVSRSDIKGRALVVEDVKSKATRTASYRIKKRLMKAVFGIEVVEI